MTWRSQHFTADPDRDAYTRAMDDEENERDAIERALEHGPVSRPMGAPAPDPCSTAPRQAVGVDSPPTPPTLTEIVAQLYDAMEVFTELGMHRQRCDAYRLAYSIELDQRHTDHGGAFR